MWSDEKTWKFATKCDFCFVVYILNNILLIRIVMYLEGRPIYIMYFSSCERVKRKHFILLCCL